MRFSGIDVGRRAAAVAVGLVLLFCMTEASAGVRWLEKSYDFGLFKEAGGPRTGSVRFVNEGPGEIAVTHARPSCGCTSVDYPLDPVAPGDTARISFTYDPTGRPGKFDKSIRVYFDDNEAPVRVGITGNVLGTPESLSLFYPVEAGPLRLSEAEIEAGELRQGASRDYFINVYNQGPDTIVPLLHPENPTLRASSSQKEIAPGDVVAFSFYFSSSPLPEVGAHRIPVSLKAKGHPKVDTTVWFSATVVPDTRRLTPEQVDRGPRCYLTPSPVDLGIVSGAGNLEFSFLIQNQGKATLEVLNGVSGSEAVGLKKIPAKVKPGKASEVKGVCHLKDLPSGPFNLKIKFFTNDPLHPVRELSVAGIKE